MTPSDRRPIASAALWLVAAAAWGASAWLLVWLALPTALSAWIALTSGSWQLGWRLLTGWRPLLFLLALTVVATALLFLLRVVLRTPKQRWILLIVLFAVPLPMLALQGRDLAREPPRSPNRWGFYTSFPQGAALHIAERGRPVVWDFHTNAEGFRAPEWRFAPQDRRERVLLVGDSFVYGWGLSSDDAPLDRKLQAELTRRDLQHPREVLNLAQLPAGLWYYARVLRAAARETRPRVLLLSFLGCSDLEPFELQRVWFGRSQRFLQAMRMLRLDDDVMVANKRATEGCFPEDSQDLGKDLQPEFEALLSEVERSGARLVVWEPLASDGQSDPFFDPWRKRPALTFVNWKQHVLPLAKARGEALPEAWQDDPTLGIAGDGHPTARANALFAEALAAEILRAP